MNKVEKMVQERWDKWESRLNEYDSEEIYRMLGGRKWYKENFVSRAIVDYSISHRLPRWLHNLIMQLFMYKFTDEMDEQLGRPPLM